MLNAKDLELLAAKGISEKQIEEQLASARQREERVSFSGNYSFGVGRERDYGNPAGEAGSLYGCLGCLPGKE
jgi:hypothetical protein